MPTCMQGIPGVLNLFRLHNFFDHFSRIMQPCRKVVALTINCRKLYISLLNLWALSTSDLRQPFCHVGFSGRFEAAQLCRGRFRFLLIFLFAIFLLVWWYNYANFRYFTATAADNVMLIICKAFFSLSFILFYEVP